MEFLIGALFGWIALGAMMFVGVFEFRGGMPTNKKKRYILIFTGGPGAWITAFVIWLMED